jgi:hypothetical protein
MIHPSARDVTEYDSLGSLPSSLATMSATTLGSESSVTINRLFRDLRTWDNVVTWWNPEKLESSEADCIGLQKYLGLTKDYPSTLYD